MENPPLTCPFCKTELEPGARACEVCGRSLSDALGAPVQEQKPAGALLTDLPEAVSTLFQSDPEPAKPVKPPAGDGGPVFSGFPTEGGAATPRQIIVLVGAVFIVVCLLVAGGALVVQKFLEGINQQAAVATQTAQVIDRQATREALSAEQTQTWADYQARTTAEASATQSANNSQVLLAEAQSWPLVLEDRFVDNRFAWLEEEGDDDLMTYRFALVDEAYVLDMTAKSGFSQWLWPDIGSASLERFYLAADLRMSGPQSMDGGLIFHLGGEEDNDFYLFDIERDGDAAVYLHGSEGWTLLTDYLSTALIKPDDFNRLEVIGRPTEDGSSREFDFFINGNWIFNLVDSTYSGGWIGFQGGLYDPGDQGLWQFDNLELRSP